MNAMRNTDAILDVLYAASETLDFLALLLNPDEVSNEDATAAAVIDYAIAEIHRRGNHANALDHMSMIDFGLKRNGQMWNKCEAACDLIKHIEMPHTDDRDAIDYARHALPARMIRR